MHHRIQRLLFLALPIVAAAQPQGSIEGVALNKLTRTPVPGVRLHLIASSEPERRYEAVTDSNGAYRIENLPAGDYSPSFDAPPGFFGPNPVDLAMKRSRVKVTAGAAAFDVEITPASVIRGRLLDPEGQPVPRATIVALPIGSIRPGIAQTDETGRYSISLAPGKYRLLARPPADRGAPTYYPGVTGVESAEPILVGEGSDFGGCDIRMRPLVQHRLRGLVRDTAGKPVPGVELAVSTFRVLTEQLAKAKSAAAGAFEFRALPPGEFEITATASREGVRWFGKTTLTLANRDLDGVEVRIDPPFAIDVDLEGAPKGRPTPVRIELRPIGAGPASNPRITEHNGHARFDAIYPGVYRLGVYGSIPGYYLQSVLQGTADVTGRPLDLGPSSQPLRLVYSSSGARVSGEVEDGAGAKVVLIWADRDDYVPGRDIVTLTCNAAARFTTSDLRPGDWYAFAFPESGGMLGDDALRQAVFDRGLWRQAQTVRAAGGQTATTLKISPWPE